MGRLIVVIVVVSVFGCGKVPQSTQPDIERTTTREGISEQQTLPPTVENESFSIDLRGVDDLPIQLWQKQALMRAKTRWEDIIVEGTPDVSLSQQDLRDILESPDYNNGGLEIDDILIVVVWGGDIEGDNPQALIGETLTIWGTRYRIYPSLPFLSITVLYSGLLHPQYTAKDWENVMLHELGHALGFSSQRLDFIGTETVGGVHYFNGAQATQAYREILYHQMGEKLAFAVPDIRVPLQDATSGHWKDPELNWEIMHPVSNRNSVLTRVTIGALADIGYIVDMTKGETPPLFPLTKPTIGPQFHCDGKQLKIINR